jgi:hypothetical protein
VPIVTPPHWARRDSDSGDMADIEYRYEAMADVEYRYTAAFPKDPLPMMHWHRGYGANWLD